MSASIKIMGIAGALLCCSLIQAVATIQLNLGGSTSDGPANAGADTVATWLQGRVDLYNGSFEPDLPTPVRSQIFRVNKDDTEAPAGYPTFGANTTSITLPVDDYYYVVLHWGGSVKKNTYAYYIGDETSAVTLTDPQGGQQGLSYYAYFTPVPEASAFLAGLAALGMFAVACWPTRR